jgi:mRNA-degrading endonuclease RelE of RelBE toxin-antitoxin system
MTSEAFRVSVRGQVIDFIRQLPPESRHRMRLAIRGLAHGRGDIKPLDGDLEGFHRLRVGSYRVVFWYVSSKAGMTVDCVFAERRSVIYLVLEQALRKGLLKPDRGS